MDLNIAYHRMKAEEFKVQEYKTLAKNTVNIQVAMAYNLLENIHLSTLTGLQTEMVYKISTLMPPPPAAPAKQPEIVLFSTAVINGLSTSVQ